MILQTLGLGKIVLEHLVLGGHCFECVAEFLLFGLPILCQIADGFLGVLL